MPRTAADLEFEERQVALANFLRGRMSLNPPTDQDMKSWYDARVMLVAENLLEACEYALMLLQNLSTEQFAAGGDKPARNKLQAAIQLAKDGCYHIEQRDWLFDQCAKDVREAITANREGVS